jgi:hypothetical protein
MSVRDSYLELSRYACSSQQFPITHSGLLRRRIHLDVVMFRATTVDHANLVSETLPFSHGTISVIWAAFLMMAFLFIYLAPQFQRSLRSSLKAWDLAIVAMAAYSLGAGYWMRTKWPT